VRLHGVAADLVDTAAVGRLLLDIPH
jgi:hypothetical protein